MPSKNLDPAHHQGVTENPADRVLIQTIHVELTPGLQQAILAKFTPLLRHEERAVRLNVRLHRDQKMGGENHYSLTAQMEVPGPDVVAHADGKDAYALIDQVVNKLDHVLERRHDRRKDKRNHPHGVEIPAELPKVT